MAIKVNLDALIPRTDLATDESVPRAKRKDSLSASDLHSDAFFLMNLYKPDFQRETNEWDINKIKGFINSFITGELIPAIILWQGQSGNIFVIDGAHRLGSLIAWINDDYGDGEITRKQYGNNITDEQANKARKVINESIQPYLIYQKALKMPESYTEDVVKIARELSSLAIQLQWVEGDLQSAEKSFLNINQKASPINTTEMKLIKSRKSAISIASRAIMNGGKGHKYWSKFAPDKQKEIEKIAEEISTIMFQPKLVTPIKTVNVPMCGKRESNALPLIYDFVNLCIDDKKGYDGNDSDGENTISCLKQTRKIARMINSCHASSLGLHPLVYFYAYNGSFKVSSFYAISMLVKDLDNNKQKDKFIRNREKFEQLYFKSANVIQVLTRKARGAKNATHTIKDFLMQIIDMLDSGMDVEEVINKLKEIEDYRTITFDLGREEVDDADFTSSKKSEIFIRKSFDNLQRCAICNGYIHKNAMSIDHIVRKQDGGKGEVENGQITHPYCNTGYKN